MLRLQLFQQSPKAAANLQGRFLFQGLFERRPRGFALFRQFLLGLRPLDEFRAVQLTDQLGGSLRIRLPHGPDSLREQRDRLLRVGHECLQGAISASGIAVGQIAPARLPLTTRQALAWRPSIQQSAGHIPEENGAIRADRCQSAAPWGKSHFFNPIFLSVKTATFLAGTNFPQADRFPKARGGEHPAIGRKSDRENPGIRSPFMSFKAP